ncbi:MAG: ABC transporter ATP-binding protein [Bifidobacterium sp.]|jgi:ABC-type glutathione transport system ATPase component|nr:ABC transporter ATP-binding protein [Bifidobacterium sp.]MCI1865406.1 ABC transporter ATP-binding protein [Bifidobacterium sp.]
MSLEIHGLSMSIGSRAIIRDVDASVADGERVGLVGASGSGKSMLARTVLGLAPVDAHVRGSALLDGRQTVGASDEELADVRGRFAGMIFQNPAASLNPLTAVVDQVMLPLRIHYDLSRSERRDRAMAMLDTVGISNRLARSFPSELSGGQQQRVAIATALVTSPRLIVADEPTTALDSITQRQILDLLVSLVDDSGASLLFITHDFSVLMRTVTRCYVLDEGRIVDESAIGEMGGPASAEQTRRLVDAARRLRLPSGRGGASAPARKGGRDE